MLYEGEKISCVLEDAVATVTISAPPMNPLSAAIVLELQAAFDALEKDDTVRCVIITGAGEKAFVAGADITEFPNWTPNIAEDVSEKGVRVFGLIENFRTPVIAAINGFALGGGLELALVCDIRLASDNARVGLPEVTLGISPGYGGTQRLCDLINLGEAKMMLYTGAPIKADKALALGIVQEVYPREELMTQAMALAKKIAANGPLAVSAVKRAANYRRSTWIQQGLAVELAGQNAMFATADHNEGISAFLEKRKSVFSGK